MGMRAIIYRGIGKLAICPKCNGAMNSNRASRLICLDCGAVFKAVGLGPIDKELEYEEVTP